MNLRTEKYLSQVKQWPAEGKHIMAQYDDEAIVVYQAYRESIGRYAVDHQCFGGEFSYQRMTWIKHNFLWMMYRSGWGTKPGQEVILAIKLKKHVFDDFLTHAVASSFGQSAFNDHAAWQQAVADSDVRLQWDPDHDPFGAKQARKAIQLGIRGTKLEPLKGEGIIEIKDISPFVAEQRQTLEKRPLNELMMPAETVYVPDCEAAINNIRQDRV
ncbi:DUF4291 domain-containing protein [Marinicella meishanensis]|uniref:DUF4291 domain-containing protein n=1 Tax=Marinicella meishanensis TaxID=2873263 RepID=UPI001CBCDB10|nr:DUF4291 domain-containing protein [Marinicella sp. NBU2979]